jgi:hypothetical protein
LKDLVGSFVGPPGLNPGHPRRRASIPTKLADGPGHSSLTLCRFVPCTHARAVLNGNAILECVFGHLHDQRLQFRFDSRPAGVTAVLGAIELLGNQPPIPSQNGVRLGHAGPLGPGPCGPLVCQFRPRWIFPDRTSAIGRADGRKIRFSTAKYSFWRSNSD